MAARIRKRAALRRTLNVHGSPTSSKSVETHPTVVDAFLCIYMLKLKVEALKREYSNLLATKRECLNIMNNFQVGREVKVEKSGEEFWVKVRCEKGEDRLVSILEAFDEMGLDVVQARVSCNDFLAMEAIVVAQDAALNVNDVTQAVTEVVGIRSGERAALGSM